MVPATEEKRNMNCTTIKDGMDCVFMSSGGCTYNGTRCHPIVDHCDGCARIKEYPTGRYCSASPDPATKWVRGLCNIATHIKKEEKVEALKINPLKASKRAAAGRKK
jgi:hypothetical protein